MSDKQIRIYIKAKRKIPNNIGHKKKTLSSSSQFICISFFVLQAIYLQYNSLI